QLKPGDVDWDAVFAEGVRWFHTGGVFAALSDTTAELALEAARAARHHGVVVSYDLNYRPSLWKARGGTEAAAAVNRELVRHVDVLFGNEEDFAAGLGYDVEGLDDDLLELEVAHYEELLQRVLDELPQLAAVGRHGDGDARGSRTRRRRRRRARYPVIVDAHQHFWDPARAEYTWMTDDVAPLRRRFGPDGLEPLLREHGVTGTVVVQARQS